VHVRRHRAFVCFVVAGLLAAALVSGACASSGAVSRGSTARPALPPINPVGEKKSKGYQVAETGLTLRGVPYRPGGSTLNGFDCSGFAQYVFRRHGIRLPREVSDQYHEGKSIKRKEIKAGDLLFFKTTGRGATHVAISIGGGRFVHAPSSTGVVRVESLSSPYWSPRFLGARRKT
jgi:cell wall-associated NlpC family hydrolase